MRITLVFRNYVKYEVYLILFDILGWDVGENVYAKIDRYIGGEIYIGVDVEIEIEGDEEIEIYIECEVDF